MKGKKLAGLLLCALAMVLLLCTVNPVKAENPGTVTVNVTLDFGSSHTAYAEQFRSANPGVNGSGSQATFTVEVEVTAESGVPRVFDVISAIDQKYNSWFSNHPGDAEELLSPVLSFCLQPITQYGNKNEQNEDYNQLVGADITLYAQWLKPVGAVSITVARPAVGTEIEIDPGQSAATMTSDPPPTVSITGNAILDGSWWYKDSSFVFSTTGLFEGTVQTDQPLYAGVNLIPKFGYYFENNGSNITLTFGEISEKDISEVYARIYITLPASYTVSFDPGYDDPGSGSMNPVYVKPDDNVYTLPECGFDAPDAEMCFSGWSVAIGGGSPVTKNPGDKITVTADTTVTAEWKDGDPVSVPVFSPQGGKYTGAQDVTITCPTEGAVIYYTTDGNDPTTDSTQYTSPIRVTKDTMIKAIAVKKGMKNSAVASAIYSISEATDPGKEITATVTGFEGVYDGKEHGITVQVTDPAGGAAVRYGKVEGDYSLEASPTAVNASDYPMTVWYRIQADGYNDKTGTATVMIRKADSAVLNPPTANNCTEDGTKIPLLNEDGTAEGGDFKYVLGTDGTTAPEKGWKSSIPATSKAGTYYVWYKVIGDKNHNDSAPACITVTISAKTAPVYPGPQIPPEYPGPETPPADPEPEPQFISVKIKTLWYLLDLKNHTAKVTKAADSGAEEITIPTKVTYKGIKFSVTEIGNGAFKNMENLKSVNIGKDVKKIGEYLFRGCPKLKTVRIRTKLLTKETFSVKSFRGLSRKITIYAPKGLKKAYEGLLAGTKLPSGSKVKED